MKKYLESIYLDRIQDRVEQCYTSLTTINTEQDAAWCALRVTSTRP